jgi:hypothetical protein
MNEEQYKLVCARRNSFNQLIWQVPTLATAVQAFLLAAAFNPLLPPTTSLILSIFSLVVGLASIQLMAKHRHFEVTDSHLLSQFEKKNADRGFVVLHGAAEDLEEVRMSWFVRFSSFRIWTFVLSGFCMLALYATCSASLKITDSSLVASTQSASCFPDAARTRVAPLKNSN